jgi:hypothetical protein
MLYHDLDYGLGKERVVQMRKEIEHDHLAKRLRLASRSPRGGLIVRSAALITSLFK